MTDREFERLVERNGQALYAFVLYRTGNPHTAEEVVADTFERAFVARGRFDRRRGSELTWLCGIALNRWRDLVRRDSSRAAALDRAALETVHAEDPRELLDERRALLATLDGIPPDERESIALVYGADLTAKQAARVLEVKTTTVQGRITRGVRRLREEMEGSA